MQERLNNEDRREEEATMDIPGEEEQIWEEASGEADGEEEERDLQKLDEVLESNKASTSENIGRGKRVKVQPIKFKDYVILK